MTKNDIKIYDPSDFGTLNNDMFCICANCIHKDFEYENIICLTCDSWELKVPENMIDNLKG